MIEVAFPTVNIDPEVGGIPAILACVAGNIFGIADIANIRFLDIVMPKEWTEPFPGPKFGIEKIRELVKSDPRYPHVGTIIKPNVGLAPKEHAELVYQAAAGGADFIKDD